MPERVSESDNINEHGQADYDENAPTNANDDVDEEVRFSSGEISFSNRFDFQDDDEEDDNDEPMPDFDDDDFGTDLTDDSEPKEKKKIHSFVRSFSSLSGFDGRTSTRTRRIEQHHYRR